MGRQTTRQASRPSAVRRASLESEESDRNRDVRTSLLEMVKKPSKAVKGHLQMNAGLMGDIDNLKDAVHDELHKPDYNVEDFYWETGVIQAVAKSSPFQNITLAVISVNAVWMGYDTDKNDSETLNGADIQFQIGEHVFAVYFTWELLVRFLAFEKKCNTLKDGWFKFDLLLCTLMVFETWMLPAIQGSGDGDGGGLPIDTGMLRLLRLMRLSRMMRLLKKCPELITLLKGMAAAMRSVGSTLVLLVIFMYVFAIIFRQQTNGNEALEVYFGSMGLCFWTLLVQGTLLDGVGDILGDIKDDSPALLVVFLLFVLIGNFTILNMLIGVLCEVVSAVGQSEAEKMTVSYAKDSFLGVLAAMDSDGSGTISQEEFCLFVNHPLVAPALEQLGVDRDGLLSLQDVIFEGGEEKGGGTDSQPLAKTLGFGDILEHILTLRSSNVAVVKDIVDLRKFAGNNNKKQETTIAFLEEDLVELHKLVKRSMKKNKRAWALARRGVRRRLKRMRANKDKLKYPPQSTPALSASCHSKEPFPEPSVLSPIGPVQALEVMVGDERMMRDPCPSSRSCSSSHLDIQKVVLYNQTENGLEQVRRGKSIFTSSAFGTGTQSSHF